MLARTSVLSALSDPDGTAHLSFDKPSDQFGSFANSDITAIGAELDHKLAALLEHLGVHVPDTLVKD